MAPRVVIDASVGLGLVLHEAYTDAAYRLMGHLAQGQAHLVVPALWDYECLSALRAAVFLQKIPAAAAREALGALWDLAPERIGPRRELHESALLWAERLGQRKAYDAQYVALAEALEAELWSADQRLVNGLKAQGVSWGHWIGEA